MPNKDERKIGIKIILRIPLFIILQAAILFVSAGRIDILRAWIFVGIIALQYSLGFLLMYKYNPELINQRARGIRQDTKSWDKVLMPVGIIMSYVVLVVIGLDVGRFQWSSLSIDFMIVGLILFVIAATLGTWAGITNPHFEPTVRIQKDRGHKVITTGPYKIVRHPGYVAAILFPISFSLIIGSLYGLIPAGIVMLLLIIRTSLEDKTLLNELDGYSKYAQRVKYRLVPGIW
ncbi:MAG: isoprenylcysteine carboxylmethyltransferase family protein [archaeon]|nr:isoprenylcysteine carboxylmethyltransferase family protein [archaeon]MCP8306415.1 isoprenylcysteine carboxylmethyltransferase family protein [archaeon]